MVYNKRIPAGDPAARGFTPCPEPFPLSLHMPDLPMKYLQGESRIIQSSPMLSYLVKDLSCTEIPVRFCLDDIYSGRQVLDIQGFHPLCLSHQHSVNTIHLYICRF